MFCMNCFSGASCRSIRSLLNGNQECVPGECHKMSFDGVMKSNVYDFLYVEIFFILFCFASNYCVNTSFSREDS